MGPTFYLIIAFIIFLAIIGLVIYRMKKNENDPDSVRKEMDYRALFSLGIIFLPVGIALGLSTGEFSYNGLTALGFIYVIFGLANREKWKK